MEGLNAMDAPRRGNLQEQLDDCRMDDRSLRGALRVGEDASVLAGIEAVWMSIAFEATLKAQQREETCVTEINSDL